MSQLKPTDKRTDRKRHVVLVVGPLASLSRNKLTKSGPSRPTVSNTIDLIVAGDTNSQTTSIITTNTTVTPPAQPTVIARVIHHLGQVSSSCNTQTSTTVTATKQLSGTCTTDTTAEVEKDPHNEVERRRKQRITRNIKTLAETLNPPCHCGKATRAEILEMVVKQIKELKQKNADLQTQINKLPTTTSSEDLSHKAFELIEENLRLRSLLLDCSSIESNKDSQESPHTGEDDPPVQQSQDVQGGSVGEERIGGDKEDVLGLHPLTSRETGIEEREETPSHNVVTDGGTVSGTEEERGSVSERGERRSKGSDRMDISEGQEKGSTTDTSDRESFNSIQRESNERENGYGGKKTGTGSREDGIHKGSVEISRTRTERGKQQHNTREVVDNHGTENNETATVEQPWPISSLLSDHSRSGAPRDHPSFTLPILSPTYIAEHCSVNCDQVFFSPQAPTMPLITTSTPNTTEASQSDHMPHNASSLYTPLPEVSVPSRVSLSSTHAATRSLTTSVCLPTSTAVVSNAMLPSHSLHVSRHTSPQTRHSPIVQPWVGCTQPTTNNPALRSVTTQHIISPTIPHTLCVEAATPSHPLCVSAHYSQPPKITHSSCHSNQHRSRNTSRHSVSRIQPNRGQMYNSQYLDPNHLQLHNVNPAPLGMYSSSHTHSDPSRDRLHSYCSADTVSLHPSSSFPMHGSSSLNQTNTLSQQQPSSCSSSSPLPDLFYQHPTATPYHPRHNIHSLHPQHQTSQDSHIHSSLHHHHHHTHHHHLHPSTHFHPHHPPFTPHPSPHPHTTTMWRPYSDRQRTSTRFNLSDILSPSPATAATSPHVIQQHNSPGGRIPSFFVDHLLDDL